MTLPFETKLKEALPRGLKTVRERGLLARWLSIPDEMTDDVWKQREGALLIGRRCGSIDRLER